MGTSHSQPSDPISKMFADCDTTVSDNIKQKIAKIDSSRSFKPIFTEHSPSLKPEKLASEISSASDKSGVAFAPAPTCIDYSIFEKAVEKSWGGNNTILNFANTKYASNKELSSCMGSLYGMIVGDSWGHVLEFVPVQYEKEIIKNLDQTNFRAPGVLNKFGLKPGQYTDDSSMGLCLADTLLTRGHVDCVDLRKRFVMWWYLGYNNAFRHDTSTRENKMWFGRSVGLGGQISMSLKSFISNPSEKYAKGDENMSGNGSIMRLCPLPIFYRDADTECLVSESMKQSFTTHSGIQSAECAAVLSYIIVSAIHSQNKSGKEFLDSLDFTPIQEYLITDAVKCITRSCDNESWTADNYNKEASDQFWNWKEENYKYSPTRSALNPGYVGGYACDNLAMALHCVYNTDSFARAVLKCINMCGDTLEINKILSPLKDVIEM